MSTHILLDKWPNPKTERVGKYIPLIRGIDMSREANSWDQIQSLTNLCLDYI